MDCLDAAEIDALPFGVIQVDGAGRVTFYSAAESRFSGLSAERVIGRDFFRDVAPCTRQPQFHGRFLEGLRRRAAGGAPLDERFRFVFGFEPQPVRVEVRLWEARAPDRYWMAVWPLGRLALTRARGDTLAAEDAVGRRSRAEPVDPSICEREPVHTPGAIQPHAAMLALDPESLVVQACSDNAGDVLLSGGEPAAAIGRPVDLVLPEPIGTSLGEAVANGRLADPARPWRRTVRLGGIGYALAAHIQDGRVIVEIERVPDHPEDFDAATPLQAHDAVIALRQTGTFEAAAAVAADEIRAMTGFERVLVYRFDADWNGEAVAESKVEGWTQSLLGLRFPASDIPAQARALYGRAPSRFVVDRDAVPAALISAPERANRAVDLTFAASRSLSPIHLEYQRNLGVNGSMSISIMIEGRLWGLVIGHHRRPHYVTPETRALADLVASTFALRVHELENVRVWGEQQATLSVQNRLLERLAASEDVVTALTARGPGASSLLDLVEASGSAVVTDGRVATLGTTPPEGALAGIANWLRDMLPAGQRAFATAELSAHYGPAETLQAEASGCLAAFVDPERRFLLLWFRPEVPATVAWGGDPNKPVLADSATQAVLPRRSFERWLEERRGQSKPWEPWQVDAAEALAAAIEGVVLRQGRKIAELTAKQAELTQALDQKDVLAREIDHRVKNSLQIVAGVMLMQSRGVSDPQAKQAFEDTYARVMSVARVHESLQHSDDVENVDLGETLRQLCSDLATGMTDAAQRLDVRAETGLMVASRIAIALSLIATELVTNALKYAYDPGEPGLVQVSVTGRDAGGVELRVCDDGRGLPPNWTAAGRKSSARPPGGSKGGLGMRMIRAMLDQIGAELSVDDARTQGVCFTVRM